MTQYPLLVSGFFKPVLSEIIQRASLRRLSSHFSVTTRNIELTKKILEGIYPKIVLEQEMWNETLNHLLCEFVTVFTVSVFSEEEFEHLVRFIGTHVDPDECEEDSLRYIYCSRDKFCFREKIPISNGRSFYFNGFHRPKTISEVKEHLEVLSNIITLGSVTKR